MTDPAGPGLIVDIGANSGDFAVAVAERNPEVLVIAVEPVVDLAQGIRARAAEAGLTNLVVEEVAIASKRGEATMNLSTEGDRGTSSLLTFDESLIGQDEYWRTREDLRFSSTETVRVVTLEDLLRDRQLETVDFLKIDAQGKDLEALLSAGAFLGGVRAGMLETSSTSHTRLYRDEPVLRDVLDALDRAGFDTYAVKPNDPAANEVNVYFVRKGEDPRELEVSLSLRGIPLYDGKHFWGRPAASMQEVEAADARARLQDQRTAQLEHRIHELEARLAELEPAGAGDEPPAEPGAATTVPFSDAVAERLRKRLRLVEAELARYHAALGVPESVSPPDQTSVDDSSPVTLPDVLSRWAETARELDEVRRTVALLSERERRATMALRKAREALAGATSARAALRAQVDELGRELTAVRHSASWRITAPFRVGARRLRSGLGRDSEGTP